MTVAMAVAATKIKFLKEQAAVSLLQKTGPEAAAPLEEGKSDSTAPGPT